MSRQMGKGPKCFVFITRVCVDTLSYYPALWCYCEHNHRQHEAQDLKMRCVNCRSFKLPYCILYNLNFFLGQPVKLINELVEFIEKIINMILQ